MATKIGFLEMPLMQAPSLKQCTVAIEELARSELGMIKRGEVFYQVLENPSAQTTRKQAVSSPASAVSGATR